MNKFSNLTSSNAISTCMSDESAHGYVFNRTLVIVCYWFTFNGFHSCYNLLSVYIIVCECVCVHSHTMLCTTVQVHIRYMTT